MRKSLSVLIPLLVAAQASALTVVLDFNDPQQDPTFGPFSMSVTTFDIAEYGFDDPADRQMVYDSIFDAVLNDFHGIPTVGEDPLSPIPQNEQLAVDFVIGDWDTPPSNGDSEYYYVQIGSRLLTSTSNTTLGISVLGGITSNFYGNGSILASVYTENINAMSSLLDGGDLELTTNAIAGTLSHEIAHLLSLEHVKVTGAITPNGLKPLLATGTAASGLTIPDRLVDREFAYSAELSDSIGTQASIQMLLDEVGTEPIGPLLGDVNEDGEVDALDIDRFAELVIGASPYEEAGDINGDGFIDAMDIEPFSELVTHGDVQLIPEPGVGLVVLWGGAVLFCRRRAG